MRRDIRKQTVSKHIDFSTSSLFSCFFYRFPTPMLVSKFDISIATASTYYAECGLIIANPVLQNILVHNTSVTPSIVITRLKRNQGKVNNKSLYL